MDIKKIQKNPDEIIINNENNFKNEWLEIVKDYKSDNIDPIETFVNKLIQETIKTKNDQWWFDCVLEEIKKIEFGNVEFKLTVKHGKVVSGNKEMMIKSRSNFNING